MIPLIPPSFLCLFSLSYFEALVLALTLSTGPTQRPSVPATPALSPASQEYVNNLAFNATLFETYKDLLVSYYTLRSKINNNKIPALLSSKIDGEPMYLAFYAKGTCNLNYGCKDNYLEYNMAEYTLLIE